MYIDIFEFVAGSFKFGQLSSDLYLPKNLIVYVMIQSTKSSQYLGQQEGHVHTKI